MDQTPPRTNSGFWEKNIAVLAARYPALAKQLEKTARAAGPDIRVESAVSGDPTLVVNGMHLHSNRDPLREGARQAEALAEGAGKANGGFFVVLGFGLGYGAEAAAKLSGLPVVVAERRPDLFRLALESRNMEEFLSPGKHILVIGGEPGGLTGALGILDQAGIKAPLVLKNRALVSASAEDREWYDDAERRIQVWASRNSINAATQRRFGKRWTKNLAANLTAIRDLPGAGGLSGCLEGTGIPVFLAAAGPSLDDIAPYAAALRERCLVVAVDTSLRFLLRLGIDPDFSVAVDPQFWNSRHLDRLSSASALVAESAVYPPVLRPGGFRRRFLCRSLFPLGRFIEDRTDPKGALGAGGSVATTAWDFARLLGPSAVWIAGLDLGFPGLKTHFRGALFEENAHAESTRFAPAETRSCLSLQSGFPFSAPSASGGRVLTDRRLSIYGAWFENRISQERTKRNYSLSGDGLAVRGLVPAAIEELLALPPRRDEIARILEESFGRIEREFAAPDEKAARERRYAEAFDRLADGLAAVRDEANRAGKTAAGAPRAGPGRSEREKILAALDAANKAVAANPVKDAAGFLFPPPETLEARLTETDPWKRHLEFSALLYRELAAASDWTLNALGRR
ncbi:MAG: DUF115 domain-containing protein [Treponema sp.]|jgi:hypothetical protein|nr:DUF115 domain-containing protein [Treponema sp.]